MLLGKKLIGTIGYMGGVMTLPEPFVWSFTQMIQYNNDYLLESGEQILHTRSTNSYHSFARNNLVKQSKGDWLLMLDTDHIFEPDLVARMLKVLDQNPEIKILSGIYHYISPPYAPKIYRFTKNMKNIEMIGDWEKHDERYLIPIDTAGAGCLLIKREVFKQIQDEFKCSPFDIKPPFSEDNSFFWRVKKLGIPVYCDPSIEYKHLHFKEISSKDYQPNNLDLKKYKIR